MQHTTHPHLGLDWPSLTLQKPASGTINGTAHLPGSKSLTNRMLLLAACRSAQTGSAVRLTHPSDSDDSAVFRQFLHAIGVQVDVQDDHWDVAAPQNLFDKPLGEVQVDMVLAGTALRFITAFACTLPGTFVLDGAPRLRERPVAALLDSLRSAGYRIDCLAREGFLPIRITGDPSVQPSVLQVDPSASSQLLSALLLLAPRLAVGTKVLQSGPASTESYVAMTLGLLRQLGWHWQPVDGGYQLAAIIPGPSIWPVEADWSAASYWLGWICLLPGTLRLPHLPINSLQGDAAQLDWVQQWGLEVTADGGDLVVRNNGKVYPRPLQHDFTATPDLAQTYAVLAALTIGTSHFTGLHTLPAKETDRLAALVTELTALHGTAHATSDSLTVHGSPQDLRQVQPVQTYHDHRMAMSFSLMAAHLPAVTIAAPGVVAKSYPGYWQQLASLGFDVA